MSTDHHEEYAHAAAAAEHMRQAGYGTAVVAIQTGSGIPVPELSAATSQPWSEVPGFSAATAPGHRGRIHHGLLAGVPAVVLDGRLHTYEGYSPAEVVRPVRALGLLGIRRLILTNASGGVRPGLAAGTLVRVTDHINLMGFDPLRGVHDARLGPRFPTTAGRAHSPELAAWAVEAAAELEVPLDQGVYAGLHGPSFETPAEVRRLRTLGVDVVGMSTVPELLAATQLGMSSLVLSLVANPAGQVSEGMTAEDEVVEVAGSRSDDLLRLITRIVGRIGE